MAEILIVDDDRDIADSLCQYLRHEGFRATARSNGLEALAFLQRTPVAAVLLDMAMPMMGGADFLRAKARHDALRDIPVLIITATNLKETPLGASRVFKKPFDMDEILAELLKYCVTT